MKPGTYLEAAAEVARVAATAAMRHYGRNPEQKIKADGTQVSVADFEAEQAAREWIEKRFPEDGIVGEEFPSVRESAPRRWIVDPIDGTFSFLRGVPFWGSIVAVAEGDHIIAGAVCCPALNEEICAERESACWFNGSKCRVSETSRLGDATVLTSDVRTFRDDERRGRWTILQQSAAAVRTWGDCYGYILVATGRADVMVDERVSAWDVAGIMPIISEAGGVFTDWKGNATAFGGDGIATNGALSEEVLRVMTGRAA
jgi:histidinol-phosphatase